MPLIQDYGQTDLDRRVLVFIGVWRGFWAPAAGAARAVHQSEWRSCDRPSTVTMKDPEFLADAAKLNMDIKPLAGEELQKIAIEVVQSPPERLARAKELIGNTH